MAECSFNFDEFTAALQQQDTEVIDAARVGVDAFGEMLIGNAQELAPVESGDLKGSATATDAEVTDGGIKKDVGFNTDYAAARHERPPEEDAPPKINPKGTWKFLQIAMVGLASRFDAFIGEIVGRAMGGE